MSALTPVPLLAARADYPPEENNALDLVEIVSGPYQDHFDIAGRSVGYARQALGVVYNIPPDAEALIDGRQAEDEAVLRPGVCLEFIRASGRKGVGSRIWDDEGLCQVFQAKLEDLDDWEARGCKPIRLKDGTRRWTEDAIDEFNGLKKACPQGAVVEQDVSNGDKEDFGATPTVPNAGITDGPFPPLGFVLDGKTILGLSLPQWKLLEIAWSHPGTSMEDAIDEVYDGVDARPEADGKKRKTKDNAMKQLAKRVNAALGKYGVLRTVSLAGGKVSLE
jgi:hypothetical protein